MCNVSEVPLSTKENKCAEIHALVSCNYLLDFMSLVPEISCKTMNFGTRESVEIHAQNGRFRQLFLLKFHHLFRSFVAKRVFSASVCLNFLYYSLKF